MTIEVTNARMGVLAMYGGRIEIDGELGNEEIVVRFSLGNNAEIIYNHLLNLPDDTDRCEECGRLCPDGLMGGLCEKCAKQVD